MKKINLSHYSLMKPFYKVSSILFLACLFFQANAQIKTDISLDGQAPCILGPSQIEIGGQYNYYTSANAQCSSCFDWDLSGSVASLANPSNDQTQNILVSADNVGSFTLYLTYFTETGCKSCSRTFKVVEPSCDGCVNVNVTGNTSDSDDCISAYGDINNCLNTNIKSVEWSYAIGGVCGPNPCPLPTETALPFSSQSVDLTQLNIPMGDPHIDYYLQFYATINYSDGSSSCDSWGQELLICDNVYTDTASDDNENDLKKKASSHDITLIPNPTSTSTKHIQFKGIETQLIRSVEILDMKGNKEKVSDFNDNQLDISQFNPGIYFVIFTTKEGDQIQKKLYVQ